MSLLVSTRDLGETTVNYSDAVLAGLAPDGGLYVPDIYPLLTDNEVQEMGSLGFVALATEVKLLFVDSAFTPSDVSGIMRRSYSPEKFPHAEEGVVTPARPLGDNIYAVNLSQGPTAAFKDMALQPLGQEMNHCLARTGRRLRILGATSGDTGSAAEAAVKGLENVDIFMLSPIEGMSGFQKAQMGDLSGGNVVNISIDGRFDDCQDLVKLLKSDPEFADLGAVNSINWSRISSQIAYYFSAYAQVAKRDGDPVDFVVPSGNFGNILAGYIARKMGLPIRNLVAATNENSVLDELIQTGNYRARPANITSSPSMDISKASNFERIAHDLFGQDPELLARYMKKFEIEGSVKFSDFGISDEILTEAGFLSGISTHQDRVASIKWAYEHSRTVIDPHTADAVTVARRLPQDGVPKVCLETALSVKFPEITQEALGKVPEREPRFRGLEERVQPGAFTTILPDPDTLKELIRNRS
jgi:threonine synthase